MAKGKVSNKRRIEALMERYNISEKELYLAMLIAHDVPEEMAFSSIMDVPRHQSVAMWTRYINDHPAVVDVIAKLRDKNDVTPGEDLDSKEGLIASLKRDAQQITDPKLHADVLMKIADLRRYKTEENMKKEKMVYYYLPLRCDKCPWRASTQCPSDESS